MSTLCFNVHKVSFFASGVLSSIYQRTTSRNESEFDHYCGKFSSIKQYIMHLITIDKTFYLIIFHFFILLHE